MVLGNHDEWRNGAEICRVQEELQEEAAMRHTQRAVTADTDARRALCNTPDILVVEPLSSHSYWALENQTIVRRASSSAQIALVQPIIRVSSGHRQSHVSR